LHQHSDDSLREKRLEAEKAELEYARQLGKEKRESVNSKAQLPSENGKKGGRRPLSLVARHTKGNVGQEEGRRSSMPVALAPAIVHIRANSDGGRRKNKVSVHRGSDLVVVAETETPNLDLDEDMSPDTSISQSSYSWASQFSGETDELRTAAHYIKPEAEEGELEELADEEDDMNVTPKDGTTRRRKKIVALAHTVRQLEGVGSREAEDPAFYDTLVKAWNERPMVGQSPYAPSTGDGQSPLPFTPNLPNVRHSEGSSQSHSLAYDDSVRSNSMRYSYASTLHDLATEGGIEQANRIFLAKPWLRGSLVGAANTQEFMSGEGSGDYPRGNNRHLSLGSSPPPFGAANGLASPIVITSPNGQEQEEHTLRKTKRFLGPIDFTASPIPSPSTEGESAPLAPPDVVDADEATGWGLGFMGTWFAPAPSGEASEANETTALTRSTTVAQFDDAPNDDSLVDAEGESDPEYDLDQDQDQVFHEAEDGGLTNTIQDSNPPVDTPVARPESSAMPSQLLVTAEAMVYPPTTPQDDLSKQLDSALDLDQGDISLSTATSTDSPSLNHYPLPTYSTPSITSYPLPLQSAPDVNIARINGGQTAIVTNHDYNEEIRSARGSCHSSDSCSSPSTKTKSRRGSRPSLTPIVTGLTEVVEEDPQVEPELVKNLRDERFSSAFLLAQSLAVPTPSIKSPTRTSSINVLSIISPIEDMSPSNHYFSPELSDAETMMGGPAPPQAARSPSVSISTSNGRLAVPRRGSSTGANTNSLHRPSLVDNRQLTLGSISELGIGSALIPSGTVPSISGESERLRDLDGEVSEMDFESRSDLGGPLSPGYSESSPSLNSPNLDNRRSRLAQSSLDSLSHLHSEGSFTSRARPTSRYQAYQQSQLEMSRRANAIVAAKMSGATPKELKRLTKAQRSPLVDIYQSEKGDTAITPEPSTAAAVLFFLGFLGPWFWIFGGWIPMGHSSKIITQEKGDGDTASVILDFSGAEDVMKGWKWTYHPDPWVKRNRRAAAVVIPLLVLGGVGAAIAVALVAA
jgi:hypothetical protein